MSNLSTNQKLRIKLMFNCKCQLCFRTIHINRSNKGISKEKKMWLEIHHIYPENEYKEFAKELDYLVPLCRECHEKVHNKGFKDLSLIGRVLKDRRILELKISKKRFGSNYRKIKF